MMHFQIYQQQADGTFNLIDTVTGDISTAQAAADALPAMGVFQIQVQTAPGVFEVICSINDGAETWQTINGGNG